jgi:hypothetical protein
MVTPLIARVPVVPEREETLVLPAGRNRRYSMGTKVCPKERSTGVPEEKSFQKKKRIGEYHRHSGE